MKIALIRKKYATHGGAELYIHNLIRALKKEGHEIHIYANEWINDDGLVFHKVPIIKIGSFLKVLSFALKSRKLLNTKSYDIIHSFDKTLLQDVYRAGDGCHKKWLSERAKGYSWLKKIFIYLNPFHILMLFIEKKIYNITNTSKVITNSLRGKREIEEIYNYPSDSICVIYNGVDINRFTPCNNDKFRQELRQGLKVSEDDILILFVGSGFERKGLDRLVKALGYMEKMYKEKKSYKLLILGKGNRHFILKLANKYNLKDKLIFYPISNMIEKVYSASDIFISLALYEPFSNACLEAISSGLPTITSRINGFSELIENKVNGIIIDDPRDQKEVAKAISFLMDKKKREYIGNNGRKTAKLYTVESNMKKTINIYNELATLKEKTL